MDENVSHSQSELIHASLKPQFLHIIAILSGVIPIK